MPTTCRSSLLVTQTGTLGIMRQWQWGPTMPRLKILLDPSSTTGSLNMTFGRLALLLRRTSASSTRPSSHQMAIMLLELTTDYVAIPHCINYHNVQSWIDDTIDFGGARIDHFAALCRCQFGILGFKSPFQPRKKQRKPSRHVIAAQLRDPSSAVFLHNALSNPAWHVDPHQSADHLAECTQRALNHLIPYARRWRRKSHVDESTWTLVEEKKQLFRQLKSMKKVRSNTILASVLRTSKSLRTSFNRHATPGTFSVHRWMDEND